MKKIYLVLLVTIILGFVAENKASGQDGCLNCPAEFPFCYIAYIPPSVCPTGGTVTVCFNIQDCPNLVSIYVTDVSAAPECMVNVFTWFINNWVRDSLRWICGYKPCSEPPPVDLYYFVPICGKVKWDGETRRLTYERKHGDCRKDCLTHIRWCMDGNEWRWEIVSKTIIGSGTCPEINYIDPPYYFSTDSTSEHYRWEIECTRIIGVNCEME